MPADAVEAVAEAVVLAYRDLGNREDRKRARLKYLIEDLGLEAFRTEVEARFGATLAPAPPLPAWHQHDHLGWHHQDDGTWFLGLPVASGRVSGGLKRALREVVAHHTARLRITPRQDLLLTGIPAGERTAVVETLRRHGVALADDLTPVRRLALACPALPTCGQALAEAERVAPDVVAVVEQELAARGLAGIDLHLRITGCPNGCARPYTAEIGHRRADQDRLRPAPRGRCGRRPSRPTGRPVGQAGRSAGGPRPVAGPLCRRTAGRRVVRGLRAPVGPGWAGMTLLDVWSTELAPEAHPAPVAVSVRPHRMRPEPSPGGALSDAELARVAGELEHAPAADIVAWAAGRFGPRLTIAASMTDAVLIDVASRVAPGIEVIFLDTQYHFQETLATAEAVRDRYPIRLRVVWPEPRPDDLWRTDPDACCHARKVLPMERALRGRDAWLSGLRQADSPGRAAVRRSSNGTGAASSSSTPWPAGPTRSSRAYIVEHDVPVNPLVAQGYPSIGCWPCTRRVADGEDGRAGRWDGSEKTECGLHQ